MQSQRKAIAMTYEMEKDDFDYWQHPVPISQIRKQVIYLWKKTLKTEFINISISDLICYFFMLVSIPLHKDLLYIIQDPDKSSILTLHWIDWQFIISQSCSRPSWPLSFYPSYPRTVDSCQSATEAITAECEVIYSGNPLTTDCNTADRWPDSR